MSDQPYRVGYRTPPRNRQFKPGQSGNPRGRPRKPRDTIDALGILDQPVTVREGERTRQMQPKEVALRRQIKAALADDKRALIHLLDQFRKYGVFDRPVRQHKAAVITIPSAMPFEMGKGMYAQFGPPPWTDQQVALGRRDYLASRDERQALIDTAMGYDNL